MAEKVILALVDGMRPDGLKACGHSFADRLMQISTYALNAQTVFPSVTLPCHMSLFHSVAPDRHGILSNTYVPQVRPITGLFEQLDGFGHKCAFFNSWEPLRDLSRPDHLHTYTCFNLHRQDDTDRKSTDSAIAYIREEQPDFLFLYLGETDEVGHDKGWMSEEYLNAIYNAVDCIEKLYQSLPEGYTLIVTADHGGHDRTHGSELKEDMTIPVLFCGPRFLKGKAIENVSIKDIAVTVAALLNVPPVREWEGTARC